MRSLTNISTRIPSALIDLRYATSNNFTGKQIYPSHTDPLLLEEVLTALAGAAASFEQKGYKILIWDAYRPASAQAQLRAVVSDDDYVTEVSNHSRGITVDMTLVDQKNKQLGMGTEFDDFSVKAHPDATDISDIAKQNRRMLIEVMESHGFRVWAQEWWHFDYVKGLDWPEIKEGKGEA